MGVVGCGLWVQKLPRTLNYARQPEVSDSAPRPTTHNPQLTSHIGKLVWCVGKPEHAASSPRRSHMTSTARPSSATSPRASCRFSPGSAPMPSRASIRSMPWPVPRAVPNSRREKCSESMECTWRVSNPCRRQVASRKRESKRCPLCAINPQVPPTNSANRPQGLVRARRIGDVPVGHAGVARDEPRDRPGRARVAEKCFRPVQPALAETHGGDLDDLAVVGPQAGGFEVVNHEHKRARERHPG